MLQYVHMQMAATYLMMQLANKSYLPKVVRASFTFHNGAEDMYACIPVCACMYTYLHCGTRAQKILGNAKHFKSFIAII